VSTPILVVSQVALSLVLLVGAPVSWSQSSEISTGAIGH